MSQVSRDLVLSFRPRAKRMPLLIGLRSPVARRARTAHVCRQGIDVARFKPATATFNFLPDQRDAHYGSGDNVRHENGSARDEVELASTSPLRP